MNFVGRISWRREALELFPGGHETPPGVKARRGQGPHEGLGI